MKKDYLHGGAMAAFGLMLIMVLLLGCARTYHIYNMVDNGSKFEQRITVSASVPKTTSVNTDVTSDLGGVIP